MLWEKILVGGLCVKFYVKFSAGCMKIVTLGGIFGLGGDVWYFCWMNENCFIQRKSCYL